MPGDGTFRRADDNHRCKATVEDQQLALATSGEVRRAVYGAYIFDPFDEFYGFDFDGHIPLCKGVRTNRAPPERRAARLDDFSAAMEDPGEARGRPIMRWGW